MKTNDFTTFSLHFIKMALSVLLSCFILFPVNAVSQGYLRVDGKKLVNSTGQEVILRGIGLGGWMLQEGYMMQTSDIIILLILMAYSNSFENAFNYFSNWKDYRFQIPSNPNRTKDTSV